MINLTIDELIKGGATANEAIDLSRLSYTARLIIQRALVRSWQVAHFASAKSVLFIQIPGRQALLRTFSSSPPTTSYPTIKISQNKSLTSSILASAGLPVIPEMMIGEANINNSADQIEEFLAQYKQVVVKPLDASHGHGITTNLSKAQDVIKAAKKAVTHSRLKKVLVQQEYLGHDVRAVCIDYKFSNSITRIPARIFGDGKSTIEELIVQENLSPIRGEFYKSKLNFIDSKKARQYLGSKGIKRVPAEQEEIQLVGISNVGAGGERVNIDNQIPDWMKKIAESASEVLGIPVSGIDFLVKELPQLDSKIEDLQPVIVEVNDCPSLVMYDDLDSPQQLAAIDGYLDYLQSIPETI